jgi:PAS domain S-box-containing protein
MALSFSAGKSKNSEFSETERLRLFVSGVTDYAIYMLSPDGIVSSWNAGAQRFKGYTAEEIIGQHFSRFYTEEDNATNFPARALQTAITHGKFEDEGWRVRKDGSQFWASVVIDAIRDEEGTLIGFAKVTRDITERKKAAEALHASEERFRLLVQGVTDYAIYMLSPEGEITNWNLGAQRIKGYEQDEVIGSHFSRFYTEDDRAKGLPMRALNLANQQGRFESEGWRVRKDGSIFWANVIIDPIRNELGELIGFAKVTRDITERRNNELALKKTQEALFQSQKLEAIGKLTGGIAHDFNNLLGVVMNGVGILRSEVNSGTSLKVLHSIERSVTRGASLTQQLLTFARQQPLKQERHDLNQIISSFENVLRGANHGGIDFDLALSETLPPVLVDSAQFESALLNLVVNARDAMPEEGKLRIITETVDLLEHEVNQLPAGCYIKVTAEDTGQGMSPEVMNRALEPFYTTKPIGKGTGLGLSQVYGFVQQSLGDLTIESTQGIGTKISLYLPTLPATSNKRVLEGKTLEKLLVVDDQLDVLEMAVDLFKVMGYEVLSANNAEDALEILQQTPDIDVLFSDVVMPGMNGIELSLQAKLLNPTIKVVLASGFAGPALLASNANLEEFQFVSKPYHVTDVIKKFHAVG